MEIKILGPGCPKCKVMYSQVQKVLKKLSIANIKVIKVEDIQEIAKHNILNTPALLIDEKVKISRRIDSTKEIMKLLSDNY
ncbi:MAG: thioredoxin family protein [Candidatus Izemoplasmatales bacterium]|nr:thioredoxin family protein [Candidatus Izemoplasmatales bacterium]